MTKKSSPEAVEETVNPEHEKLLEVLRFTPCEYKVQIWGYGGEKVMGTVDRKIYDYFKQRRLDLSEYSWDGEYADEHTIPEDMQPFPAGSWYECDDIVHAYGANRDSSTLNIEDENGETIYEKPIDELSGWSEEDNHEPEFEWGDEHYIDEQPAGTVVFLGDSSEKGGFFEGKIELKSPFDITKLTLCIEEVDGEELITNVKYDGEELDNWGASTNGKGSSQAFFVAGSQKATGKWEKYTTMDDIEYEMTPWFPKKIKPVREGVYQIKTAGKNSWTHQAKWTGEKWTSTWGEDEIKIKEWQGLAQDPDAEQVVTEETQNG